MSEQEEGEAERKGASKARRIEADPRTEEFVVLFQRYGETVVNHVARNIGRPVDPNILSKVNRQVEPMLRQRIEALVKDYLRTAYETLTGEEVEAEEVGYRVQFPRRRRYHLRFLTLAFSDLVAFDEKALVILPDGGKIKKGEHSPAVFSKSILEGIDLWSRQVLDRSDIEAANLVAFKALDRLDITADSERKESDRELWRRLFEFEDSMSLVCPVLMPFLREFHRDFEGARTQMQRAIGTGSEGRVQLNAKMWDLLFARIFGRVLRYVGGEERPDMAAQLDEKSRAIITGVTASYRRWRKENQLK
jgi:hypothetical protein